jgi:hypothetical protein
MNAAPTLSLAIAALVLGGCAAPPQGIAGSYIEHIDARDNPPWRDLIGDFQFDFRANGELRVHQVGGTQVDALARYRLDGDLLTIVESGGTSSCRESGVDLASALYRVRFVNDGIDLQVLRDECRGRREAMPLRPLHRMH